jgi:hypothetical protein
MANYNKSFNFRNGVQVDNDNFIVNANGLVGIGTTIPESYLLNVYGDTRVTGLVTATSAKIGDLNVTGVSTVGFLTATNINASGVITATTFYGDAAGLTNIYAIAVDGWYVNVGSISTVSNVGVGTTLPTGNFQVGVAVTINSDGNATYVGIITAASFSGVGSNLTQLNASSISSGTLANSRLPADINISGVATASSFDGIGSNLTQLNASNISSGTLSNSRLPQSINVSGIVTAYSFTGFGTDISGINASNISSGTLSNSRLPQSINVSGIVTAAGGFAGNVTGTASTAQSLTGTPSITVGNITAANLNASGIITTTTLGVSGLTTTTTLVSQTSIGIGTNNPIGDLQIKNATAASILVTSDTQSAIISIGRSNSLETSNGVLRFGNISGIFPYSNGNSLDILNYSTGNLNFYLEAGTPGIGTGNFYWHRRKNFARLMTLTYGGNLGIGITTPSNTLHVVGTSTVTNNAYFGSNVEISGNLSINGSLVLSSFTADVNGNLTGNVNAASGISTFNDIKVTDKALFDFSVGIGTTNPNNNPLEINSVPGNKFTVNVEGSVGVKTSVITNGVGLDALNTTALFGAIGVGTTSVRAVVDFADAGKQLTGGFANRMYMYPPRVTTTQRNNLTGMLGGAMVYNVTLNRLEYYDSSTSGWKYISGTSV